MKKILKNHIVGTILFFLLAYGLYLIYKTIKNTVNGVESTVTAPFTLFWSPFKLLGQGVSSATSSLSSWWNGPVNTLTPDQQNAVYQADLAASFGPASGF